MATSYHPNNAAEAAPAPTALEVNRVKELLKQLCIARSNIVLYSIKHSLARGNLREVHRDMSLILKKKKQIDLNVVKHNFLFEGLPLEERNPMVSRLAGDLRHLHINGVTFYRGVTLQELGIFFQLLTLKREKIEEYDGPQRVLEEMGVEHIKINLSRYIRLDEGKKVVSLHDRLDKKDAESDTAEKKELLESLWRALAARRIDRDWLLDEIRADPEKTAANIITLLKRYDELDDGLHEKEKEEAVDTLMRSVQALGIRLAEAEESDDEQGRRTVAQSMLLLERELKARSADLKSSRAVSRFIREITATITSFIDHQQTEKVMKTYLKDEAGLQKTETLLRRVMARDSSDKIIFRIKKLLQERGVSETEIEKIFGTISTAEAESKNSLRAQKKEKTDRPKKKKKKRRRRAPKPVEEKLEKAIHEIAGKSKDSEKTISYLAGVFRREIKKEIGDLKSENKKLSLGLKRASQLLTRSGINLAVLGPEGDFLLTPDSFRPPGGKDDRLDPALRDFLGAQTSPSPALVRQFLARQNPEDRKRFSPILENLDRAITDRKGNLLGLLFKT